MGKLCILGLFLVNNILEAAHRKVKSIGVGKDREETIHVGKITHDGLNAKLGPRAGVSDGNGDPDLQGINPPLRQIDGTSLGGFVTNGLWANR